jgi:hypothetical protein
MATLTNVRSEAWTPTQIGCIKKIVYVEYVRYRVQRIVAVRWWDVEIRLEIVHRRTPRSLSRKPVVSPRYETQTLQTQALSVTPHWTAADECRHSWVYRPKLRQKDQWSLYGLVTAWRLSRGSSHSRGPPNPRSAATMWPTRKTQWEPKCCTSQRFNEAHY